MSSYIHRVVNNYMVSNGGGWASEIKTIPKGYKLDSIIPLDVYTSCMIFVRADDPVSDLVTKNSSQDNTYTYPPSDPKRKANT